MSRQTYREPSGRWGVKGVDWGEIPDGLYGALYKLRRYEDLCEEPIVVERAIAATNEATWVRVDAEHHVWRCKHCGKLHKFEADGPIENGFACCPYCGFKITHTEGDEDEPA